MKVKLNKKHCLVTKEKLDPKIYNNYGSWGNGESRLLYHVKNELNKQGYDFIKKRMCKDGHLVDDSRQYLRQRNRGKEGLKIAIYNSNNAIYGANERYNEQGFVRLHVDYI